MKNSNDTIGNLTRDFLFVAQYPPSCQKPLHLARTVEFYVLYYSYQNDHHFSIHSRSHFFFYYHGGISEIIFYLPWRNLRNKFLYPDDSHAYENENKQKKHLDAYGDYSSTANCRKKFPFSFEGKIILFEIFSDFY